MTRLRSHAGGGCGGSLVKTDRETEDGKVRKHHYRYGSALDCGNLANIGHHRLLAGFTRILTACARALRPGGHVVVTVRPWREHAELIDLPSQVIARGTAAGLVPVERCVALLARIADDGLVVRGSFVQRDFIRKQREGGLPLHLIAHEDVIIFRAEGGHASRGIAVRHEFGAIGPGHWGRVTGDAPGQSSAVRRVVRANVSEGRRFDEWRSGRSSCSPSPPGERTRPGAPPESRLGRSLP